MTTDQVPFFPALTPETLDAVMQQRIHTVRNDTTSIPMLWQGLYRMALTVSGQPRTLTTYVPKDTPQGTAIILMNVPEGEDTLGFLEKTHWKDIADSQGIVLFLAEPGSGGWGSPEQEQAYLEQCFQFERAADYLRGGLCEYMVGYGPIGTCLHKIALATPLKISAAVFLDASDIPTDYLCQTERQPVQAGNITYNVLLKDIPVPVWVRSRDITPEAQAVISHWTTAIGASEAVSDSHFGTVFLQGSDSLCTPEGRIVKVAVQNNPIEYTAPETTQEIYSFLKQYFRYGSNGPYGNTLGQQVDYTNANVEVKYYKDDAGVSRECLIYVPEAFRGKGPLPLVLAIHGSSESCWNYFEESLFYRKADQAGFILVMPEGTLKEMPQLVSGGIPKAYRSCWEAEDNEAGRSDIEFCEMILDDVIARYAVDTRRIYCTGHSMGSMMTSYIGTSMFSHRFAAMAATSGPTIGVRTTGTQPIPIYFTMGEHDLWDWDITPENEMANTLNLWLIRNGLAEKDTVRDIRISGAAREYDDGRHHCFVWENEAQQPLVRYDWVRGKDHMNTPEENFRFWDEWFSKWSLEEDGRCYHS